MTLNEHLTDSIFRRYDIIPDDDLAEAMEKAQEHLKKEAENRREVDFCIEDIGLDIKKRGKLFVRLFVGTTESAE